MQRRSAHISGPRKKYTVDAFAGIEELQAVDDDTADVANDESGDEFESFLGQEGLEEDDDDEPISDEDANDLLSDPADAADADLNEVMDDDIEPTPPPLSVRGATSASRRTYTHGLHDAVVNGKASKGGRRLLWCGPAPIDYEPFERAVHKWGSSVPLPQREANALGQGGFAPSFHSPADDDQNEALGRSSPLSSQPDYSLLNQDQCRPYTQHKMFRAARFLLGHHRDPRLFRAEPGQALPLPNNKPGFILNVGTNIGCLEWVPKQDSADQYLTVSLSAPDGSAFQPRPPYKSTIQIWRIGTSDQTAVLQQVLCSERGDAIWMKWSSHGDSLASVWSDGGLSVLQGLRCIKEHDIRYVRLNHALVEYRAPDTVFTCATWLSRDRIAGGCANGCIAVFDINSGKNRPTIYQPVADTYIVNISSCAPSRPHLVLVTTPGGRVTVTDITRPYVAGQTTSSQRVRTGASQFVWNDHGQCVVSTDDARGIHALPIRKLSHMKGVGSSKAVTTAIAGSPCHPYVLVGGVGGDVICLNPLQRILSGRNGPYQLTWFQHEWRRPTESDKEPLSRFAEGFKVDEVSFGSDENKIKGEPEMPEIIVQEEETAVAALSWNPNLHAGGWAAAALTCGLIRVEDIAV